MTSAKQKLETLSHSWYGYAVCATLFSIFGLRASGMVSFAVGLTVWAVINAVILIITLAIMAFFSKKLLARSSGTRMFLVVVSAIFTILGVLNLLDEGRVFIHWISFTLLLRMAATTVSIFMNARSFTVLNSSDVRKYFA